MHLFLVIDGNFQRIEQFKRDLQGHVQILHNTNPITKELYDKVCVRNVQLIDLSFPEECLEQLLYDLRIGHYNNPNTDKFIRKAMNKVKEGKQLTDYFKNATPEEIKEIQNHFTGNGGSYLTKGDTTTGSPATSYMFKIRTKIFQLLIRIALGLKPVPKVKLDCPHETLGERTFDRLRYNLNIIPLGTLPDPYAGNTEIL